MSSDIYLLYIYSKLCEKMSVYIHSKSIHISIDQYIFIATCQIQRCTWNGVESIHNQTHIQNSWFSRVYGKQRIIMIPKTHSITKRCKIIIIMNTVTFTTSRFLPTYVKYHEVKAKKEQGEKAWSGTEYSSACFAYCRKFVSLIISAFPVHSTAFFPPLRSSLR